LAVSRPNLRYRLCSKSAGLWVVAGPTVVFCAPTKSTLSPEIKIEIARKVMVRDLCRVFIIPGMKHCEYYFTAEIAKTAEKIIKQINI
jgi:hypothetical protein